MKHKLLIIVLLIDMLLLLSVSSCQNLESAGRTAGTPGAAISDQATKGTSQATSPQDKWQQMINTDTNSLKTGSTKAENNTVYVASFSPQGQTRSISEVDEINITFSEPVAPLQKVEKNAPSLFAVSPMIKGEGFWKSSTTYSYRFDEKLKYSSAYKVHFRGYKTFAGKIAAEKQWTFTTPTITIINTAPYHESRWQTLDQKVLVQFSQDVDPGKISKYISIQTPAGNHPYNTRYANEKERELIYYDGDKTTENKKFVTISPTSPFPMASDIKVRFAIGLPSTEGNVGLQQVRELGFRTFEIFAISSVADQFQPDTGIKVIFTNPVNIKHFMEKVSFEPKVEVTKEGDWNTDEMFVHGKFKPGSTYTMKVPADLQDQFGNRLGKSQQFTVKSLDYSAFIAPPNEDIFVLENYLEKKIPVGVRNKYTADVYYKPLDTASLKKMYADDYLNPGLVDRNSCTKYIWQIPAKKNRNYVLGFDLETIKLTAPGYYYIYFSGAGRYEYPGHIFQLTDTALVAKYSPTQIFLVPFNMKTGELVPNLVFDIDSFKSDGTIAGSIMSRADGTAVYEPDLNLLDKNNLLDCFVFTEPNKSFIWGKKYEMMDMWQYRYSNNINYNDTPSYYYNHLLAFTDKYLYKGGQTVKFKSMLRQIISGRMGIPAVNQIEVEVFNSRNEAIKKFAIPKTNVTAYGSFAGEFVLPQDAPTGYYRINFTVKLAKSTINQSTSFSVQEYKPAKYEVAVTLDQPAIIAGQSLSGKVNARYLFGTPMKKATGNCIWTIQNTNFTPAGWETYSFGTYDSQDRQTIYKKDFTMDDNGDFLFKQDTLTIPFKNSAQLTAHGEVMDKDNNRIAASKSLLVHRGEYYIGLKSGSYFFKQGKPGKIMLATISPAGKPVSGTGVNIKIVREEWKSFQQKDASGALRWEWNKVTEDVVTENLKLSTGTLEKEYTFKKPGYYNVYLSGKDGLKNDINTTGYFYVTGDGYVSWGVNEGRTIDIVTDKTEYKPGESIEVLIKSPFETSMALITVEREQVMWSKVMKLQGNASTVTIPVDKKFMPNAFINVIILKERTGLKFDDEGNDKGKPEFYAGYKEVNIDASEKKLKVNITANKLSYEPGDQVTLDVKVTGKDGAPVKSEVCVSIVDKGVLNLVGYQLPDPFEFFWAHRALDVKTVSTLNDVLGRRQFKEKGENPGGDGGGAAFGSVVVRKNFKESAFYTAFIETDANGVAHVSFKLPDNLTTFKAMVVAGNIEHRFGRGDKDLLVKKNLILKPAVPNFSRPGDSYSAGVTVTNNSPTDFKVAVEVKYENVEREKGDSDKKVITLKAGDTQAVWYKFKVPGVKTQKLTFRAAAGTFSDGLYQEIPVRMPQFMEAVANFGRVEEAAVTERLIVPDKTLRELDKIEITLASSAMVGVKRNFDILQEYPYDCLEQRISKQYPLVGAADFLLTYGLLNMKKEDIAVRVNALLKMMPQYQDGSGGFKYYPDCIFPSPYLSCYAVEFILDARAKGYAVDKAMLTRAEEYLKGVALKSVDYRYPYSKNIVFLVQSYAVYALAKDTIFMGAAVNNLFEMRDRIPYSGLAYLVKALDLKHNLPKYMQPVLAKTMLNKIKDEPTMTHFENIEGDTWYWVHESNVKTTAIVLDAFLSVYGRFPYAEKMARWLTTTTTQKRYMSTQEHLRLFMAFEHYYRVFEKDTPNFVAEVLLNGLPKLKETFDGRELTARRHAVMLQEYQPGSTVETVFKKQGVGMLYYLLRLKYYPIGEVEAIDRGFKVSKNFTHLDGTVVKNNIFVAGEKYIVEVVVESKMERSFVMLDDPLPAGLSVLNPDFKTGSALDNEKVSTDNGWDAYWGDFYRSEIYFDRVQVFADYLTRGMHKWKYLAIATNSGSFTVPNTVVSEMYNPEVFGRNANRNVKVN